MKYLFAFLFLFPIILPAHPIKMSLFFIGYKTETNSGYVECRMFGDDLNLAIEEEMSQKISLGYWSKEEEEIVNEFVNKHVQLSFGERTLLLDFYEQEFDPSNNVITLKYFIPSLPLNSGETIALTNSLFFKQFRQAQTNIFQLDIPNVAETTLHCYMNDYTKIFTIK